MANPYQINITARDKTAEAFKSVNDNFAKLAKGTPLEKVTKSFQAITEKGRSFGEISKAFRTLSESSTLAAGGIGEASADLVLLGAAAGPIGIAVGAIGAGLTAAAAAAFKFVIPMAEAGERSERTAARIGMARRELVEFQRAGEIEGVNADATAEAFQNLGDTLFNARWGSPEQRGLLAALDRGYGFKPKFDKNGFDDLKADMLEISEIFDRQRDPAARRKLTGLLGVTGISDELNRGSKQFKAALDAVDISSAVPTDEQQTKADQLHATLAHIKLDLEGIKNVGFDAMAPFLNAPLSLAEKMLSGVDSAFHQKSIGDFFGNAFIKGPMNWLGSGFGLFHTHVRAAAGAPAPTGSPAAIMAALEKQFGLPPGMLDAVWSKESSRGRNLGPSPAGARGHFQFMPKTAARYGLKNPNDFATSAVAAARYLADLMRQFGGDPAKALAGYNWGEDHLAGDIARHGADWRRYAPRETQGYVGTIIAAIKAAAVTGAVKVDVSVSAPPGSSVRARTAGRGVTASARITPTLAGANI